ncbi:hypothetical protein K493DRAFT_362313 [Basidiobolus meristosporus CBS 931.73]|uniref:Phosphatidic acid phosphatase type 2/haloperoxidase domain-containing protein n=1 Tax=Basidiobolus meristosporus CBS 931.73 TaxID=1314790 RepID=A0A1Y1X3K8_9FUNG|nr:hypothetical protein K493DRAFT_362313 [Basidiobolus meristosporus CBS 931.73]|eukprot:ORX80218.1 hypothetical protein K493DRAFT_362313 [Basidiobolus meristosporus CBS 931.73]
MSLDSSPPTRRRWFPWITLSKDYFTPYRSTDFPRCQESPFDVPDRRKRPYAAHVLDWLVPLILGFFLGPVPPKKYFRLDDTSLQHPIVTPIVTNVAAPFINLIAPWVILLIFNLIFIGNKWDAYHMTLGLAQAALITLFMTSIFWVIIGGLRPNFLAKCNPDPNKIVEGTVYYTIDICRNPLVKDDFHGGHASTAFCGWSYFSLYMFGKLKVYNGTHHFWKLVITVILPLVVAVWVSASRILDFNHFFYQLLFGGILGLISSYFAYQLHFDFMWMHSLDYRNSHIPVRYITGRQLENGDALPQSPMLERTDHSNENYELRNV